MALGPNGTIVVAGSAAVSEEDRRWAFVRYRSNGSLDSSFSGDGIQTLSLSGWPWDVAVQTNGSIVGVGGASGRWTVVRLRPGGALDPSFGAGGIVQTSIGAPSETDSAVAVQLLGDGRIVVGGRADADFGLARYLANGELDASFGVNGVATVSTSIDDVITDLTVLPDGKVVAAGYNQAYDPGYSSFRLARFLTNGALDPTFGSGGLVGTDFPDTWEAHPSSISVQPDGKLVVAGNADPDYWYHSVFALARYRTDGSLDTSFGDGGTRQYDFGCDGSAGYGAVLQPVGSRLRIVQAGGASCYGEYHMGAIGVETDGPPFPRGAYRVETRSGQSIIPGTTQIDNRCSDCTTEITLPWTVWVYGIPYRTAHASSNGTLQFSSASASGRNGCLPFAALGTTVVPFWDDLSTRDTGGIWTGISGAPGSRQFVVEWRGVAQRRYGNATFEVVLTEGSPTISVVYGASTGDDPDGASVVSGIQRGGEVGVRFTCWEPRLVTGLRVDYVWDGELAQPPPPRPPAPPPPPAARRCIVPRVVGKTLRRARARIRARGCAVGRIRRVRSRRPRGRVIGQKPRPGSHRPRGTRVQLVLSRGRRGR